MSRKEVADLAGVSEATVSRVLNGVGPMKEETRQKVQEAVTRLNYTPSALARSFATSKSGNLGVVLPYVPKVHMFSTYFFSEILSGIGSKSRELGYDVLLLFRTPDEVMNYARLFHTHKVDACIILGAKDEPTELESLRRLKEEKRHFCLINQHYEGELFSEVDADHILGSYQAVQHLIDQDFKRIAFINGPSSYSNSRDRLAGYKQALAENNLQYNEKYVFEGNFSRSSGYMAASAILPYLQEIDAVFASNDRMAIGLQQGLRDMGIHKHLFPAMVGYDNSDSTEVTSPTLSSVEVPFFEMGELAVEKLVNSLENSAAAMEEHFSIHLPTKLIVRESSVMKDSNKEE
ncbi:LacI family transcriptional regulator [Paenibacillus sp. DS2015]